MLDDFLELLRGWRLRGAIWFDDDEVAAPHAVVTGFDLAGLGRLAQTLRTQSDAVSASLAGVAGVADGVPLTWSGLAGAELQTASAQLAVDLNPVAHALRLHAASATTAHDVLADVVHHYRATMTQLTGPIAATAAVGEVRGELSARLDLAAAAGHAASTAVADGVDALHDEWRSSGELILAGER